MGYNEDDSGNRKRYAIIGVSSMLLVAMVAAVTVGVNLNQTETSDPATGSKSHEITTSTKAIKTICATVDYKEDCMNSLKSAGHNSSDPKELIQAGFNAAVKLLQQAADKSVTLKEIEKDPRTSQALAGCKELMNFAIDELKYSFKRLGDFDITKLDEMLIDLKIWLSATITYQVLFTHRSTQRLSCNYFSVNLIFYLCFFTRKRAWMHSRTQPGMRPRK